MIYKFHDHEGHLRLVHEDAFLYAAPAQDEKHKGLTLVRVSEGQAFWTGLDCHALSSEMFIQRKLRQAEEKR